MSRLAPKRRWTKRVSHGPGPPGCLLCRGGLQLGEGEARASGTDGRSLGRLPGRIRLLAGMPLCSGRAWSVEHSGQNSRERQGKDGEGREEARVGGESERGREDARFQRASERAGAAGDRTPATVGNLRSGDPARERADAHARTDPPRTGSEEVEEVRRIEARLRERERKRTAYGVLRKPSLSIAGYWTRTQCHARPERSSGYGASHRYGFERAFPLCPASKLCSVVPTSKERAKDHDVHCGLANRPSALAVNRARKGCSPEILSEDSDVKERPVRVRPNPFPEFVRSFLFPFVPRRRRSFGWPFGALPRSSPRRSPSALFLPAAERDRRARLLCLNKRFILSFLHAHGKLFTKVGMETFPEVAGRVLQEFRALLQHSPSPLGSSRMLQIVTINMFAVHNAQSRDAPGEARSVLQEQTTALGLAMFALLVRRCTDLLRETPAAPPPVEDGEEGEEGEVEGMVRVSSFPTDLRELLPSVKVWSDWMLGHPEQWNPPPCSLPLPPSCCPDVWRCLADLCNALACVYHGEAPLYKADGDEDLRLLLLEEDRLLAGFVPLLAAPQEPCYMDAPTNTAIAADCKRVTVLKYFLEALCGQEEPLLAFKGGKYVSVATLPPPGLGTETGSHRGKQADNQDDDVIVEAESSQSEGEAEVEGEGSEDDIRELRARRHALTHKLALQQRRHDKIQAVLQTCRQLELEIRPLFLVPDTNGFIDHLLGLRKLMSCGLYILVVPLIVITELDGLAKGQENRGGGPGGAHARGVQERAKAAVGFLEQGFEAREPCLRALTSRGTAWTPSPSAVRTPPASSARSRVYSGRKPPFAVRLAERELPVHGNNDDLILSCCLHYCKDKAKDFMPTQRDEPVRLHREVVLLTDDRNLRVKALTRNVPVRDIPAFLSWAKVG
ncbi:hypothetical protein AAFF_G00175280 [Aldrovandia affinis]|uniref:Telomerase-binding protein EST1A n=1 Tax=Aldrovandia affinis TaxID=143900 RepID=A0AAD7RLA7_9TELE|nr:hypothetical protein AAFF_G00175280 [Aldrovandia affinis]